MTITANPVRNEYTATAGQTVFNYDFKIYNEDEIDVYVGNTIQNAYTVTGVDNTNGGTIIFDSPRTAGQLITIVSSIPEDREVNYVVDGDFSPDAVNTDIDRTVSLIKQKISRSAFFPDWVQGIVQALFPAPEDNKLLAWDGSRGKIKNKEIEQGPGIVISDTGQTINISTLDGSKGFIGNTFTSVDAAKADEVAQIGDFIKTSQYFENTGIGGAVYQVVGSPSRDFVTFADHIRNDGKILQYIPKNSASIPAEDTGVIYAGPGIAETERLQAAIDVGRAIQNAQADPDSGIEIQINGWIRIDDTLERIGRTRFYGISQARSRIIWNGGSSTKEMFQWGSATWGGFSRIRVQAFDQNDGQTVADACSHICTYTFIDFQHTHDDFHLIGSADEMIILTTGSGENALTNFMMSNARFDPRSTNGSAIIRLTQGIGGNRPINIVGCTVDAQGDPGPIVDCSTLTSGICVNMMGARLEYNSRSTDAEWAFFKMGGQATNESAVSTVTLNGVSGYTVNAQNTHAIVRQTTSGCCSLSKDSGSNLLLPPVYDAQAGKQIIAQYTNGYAVTLGGGSGLRSTSTKVIGESAFISANFQDRQNPNAQRITRADKVYTNDGVCDYIRTVEEDELIYSYASTGFSNAGQIAALSAGSAVATLPAADYGSRMIVNLKVRITGAGPGGTNLDTHIVSVDPVAQTVTFNDAASTTVGTTTVLQIGAQPFWGFDKPRQSLPANPPTNSRGTTVFVKDLGCYATWEGARWVYGSGFSCSTANRPSYGGSVYNVGRMIFDTTLNQPLWWSGSNWRDATGTIVP